MNGRKVKETMDQIHISEEMQEEMIMNIQRQMGKGKNKTWNWNKLVAAAAALILIVGVAGIPVQAVIKNIVEARMESIPEQEMQEVADMIEEQKTAADSFSRDYSDQERERMQELHYKYENGTFPEKQILKVEHIENVAEGTLCYVKDTGEFYLPDRELTDEELLEIIDLNHQMSYVVEQSPVAQEARKEYQEEQDRRREQVQAFGGISEEEAVEIARNQMKSELGAAAEEKTSLTVHLLDISQVSFEHKGDVSYFVVFQSPIDKSNYGCEIDAVDGSILDIYRSGK